MADDALQPEQQYPPRSTLIKRWEAWISIIMFAIMTAVQQEVIPEGKWSRLAMWFVAVLAQTGLIFGRPLLVSGVRQTIQIEKGKP